MTIYRAPLSGKHIESCDAAGALLLRQGVRIEQYDAVTVDHLHRVDSVFVHVMAERDVPNPDRTAEDPVDHAAGDCWQEVWHVWPIDGAPGIDAMRVV